MKFKHPDFKEGNIIRIRDDIQLGEMYSTYIVDDKCYNLRGSYVYIRAIGGPNSMGFVGVPADNIGKEPGFIFGYDTIDWTDGEVNISQDDLLEFLDV